MCCIVNIEVKGYKVNYIDKGEGPAVVLLHGWGSSCGAFNFIINNLEDEYIEDLQSKLFVEDFSEMNELARAIGSIYADVAGKINKILENCSEISIPKFYEIAEHIDDFDEDEEDED